GHAFLRTVLYLDYDRKGFHYPIVPFHVNCYGSDLRIPAERLTNEKGLNLKPPPSPPPWRCYDMGKEVARIIKESPWRVAVVGSSSWSHGSLTAKHHFMYPDTEADQQRLRELKGGELKKWRHLEAHQMRGSGQHEMLNWLCLAGAMEDRKAEVLAYGETYLFNSDKAVVLFPV
ncbi:MAG: extradiol ring-cleavage dioxygenase, partial [Deltaproteobacteria bacterium]|nr:extradiol ring-cleavage dioxygenase [Deltaproteobacteria bacterium]